MRVDTGLRAAIALLLLPLVGISCAPGPAENARTAAALDTPASTQAGPRGTLRIAWFRVPDSLHPKFYNGPQMAEFGWTFNSTLTHLDFSGRLHPMMARDIPSRDNGGWVVNPDGTMITTYRLRSDLKWHDGEPITSHDFVFAYGVYADPDALVMIRSPEDLISSVVAADDHTTVIHWKQPFVRANMLGYQAMDPLPRHLLEAKYRASPAEFSLGEEFRSAYIGSGPYRVERYEAGSRILARANREWFFAVPRIELVEIRLIPDNNTLMANMLAGEVQLTSSPAVRGNETALWREQRVADGRGYVLQWETMLRYMWFQFREVPGWQRDVADLRVRRAMMHAIDRQALTEAVNSGLGRAAEVFFLPNDTLFPEVDRAIAKYPYDPARASALLADAGWRRGAGSDLLVDVSGRTLDLDPWRSAGTAAEQELSIISDYWKQVGINSKIFIIPAARRDDNEFISGFPATYTAARFITHDGFIFTSSNVPTAELRWNGSNRGSFRDAEIDRLHNLVNTSLDPRQQTEATIALHARMTEVLGIGPLYYEPEVILASSVVKGPIGNHGAQPGATWNIFEWEVAE